MLRARPVVTGDALVTMTEITGLRSSTVGDFGQESDRTRTAACSSTRPTTAPSSATPDEQRVKLSVRVTPETLDPAASEIRWELRDPDDPANHPDLDTSPNGGDNTGAAHEGASHWFVQAEHAISEQINRDAVNENTVIGEARPRSPDEGGELVSTVYLRYADDAGDNYRVRAVLAQADTEPRLRQRRVGHPSPSGASATSASTP